MFSNRAGRNGSEEREVSEDDRDIVERKRNWSYTERRSDKKDGGEWIMMSWGGTRMLV